MDHLIDNAAHWRDRANKIRALAEDVEDHDARVSMLRNADEYDNLANRAKERMSGSSPSGPPCSAGALSRKTAKSYLVASGVVCAVRQTQGRFGRPSRTCFTALYGVDPRLDAAKP